MSEDSLPIVLAAGREGVPSPQQTYTTRVLPGAARNRIELARTKGGVVGVLEGRWLRTVSICFSGRDRWVAASGYAGGVSVWEAHSGALVAEFTDVEAQMVGEGRLPVAFTRGDGLLVSGGRRLSFIETGSWKVLKTLEYPVVGIRALDDAQRIAVYEAADGAFTRWTMNVKSFDIEGADRLRETRVYRGLFSADRRAS